MATKQQPKDAKFERLRQEADKLIADRLQTGAAGPVHVQEVLHELEVHQVELERQNEELKRAQDKLTHLYQQYEELYEFAPCAYVNISFGGIISRLNLTGVTLLKQPRQRILGNGFGQYIVPDCQRDYYNALHRAKQTGEKQSVELQLRHSDGPGPWILMEMEAMSAGAGKEPQLRVTFVDISSQKKAETDLLASNRQLRREIDAHKRTQEQLRERQARLEDANAALKVLLRTYDAERSEWEERVVSNIESQARPYLSKLAATGLNRRQKTLLEAAATSLDDLLSPLNKRLSIDNLKLTPSEIQVAKLIRQGKSTKEIAGLIGVATSTIDYHRHNIRRKLKLSNQKVNLQSYLQSLE